MTRTLGLHDSPPAYRSSWMIMLFVACVLGAAVPFYVDAMGDGVGKLMALPGALLAVFILFFSRSWLLLAIVIARASTESLFDSTRVSLGGMQIGVGGLLNGFAILIALMLVVEKPQRFARILAESWAPFLAIVLFGAAIAPDRGSAARLFLQLTSEAAVFVGGYYVVRSRALFDRSLWLIVWSSAIPLAFGVFQLASGGGHDYPGEGLRIRSTFSHPNPYAFYLTLVVSVVFYLLKRRVDPPSHGRAVVLWTWLAALLAALLLTKTRSAWLACFAMFVAYAVMFERRYFVYLALAAVAGLFVPGVGDRVLDATQGEAISSYTQLNSFEWRRSLWESALAWMTKSHYLYGYGLEGFKFWAPTFFKESNGINWGAHNVYVQLFFDLGILGVAAFVWLYARLIARLRALARSDRMAGFMLVFVLIEFLVVAASDNMLDYLSFNWYLWFLVGAGTALTVRSDGDAAAATRSAAT